MEMAYVIDYCNIAGNSYKRESRALFAFAMSISFSILIEIRYPDQYL